MKIILINNVFPPGFIGGYELGMYELVDYLSSRGHTIYVITSDYFIDDNREINSFLVERSLDCPAISHESLRGTHTDFQSVYINWKNIRRLASLIRYFKPDLIISGNTAGLGPASIAMFLEASKIPVISYYMDNVFAGLQHFPNQNYVFERLFGNLKELNDFPVFMSRNLSDEMSTFRSINKNRAIYIPGWVRTTPYLVESEENNDNIVRFIFSSRVAQHKGIDIIVEAVSNILHRGLSNFVVDVYGSGQVTSLLQDVRRRGLDRFVQYRGVLPKTEMTLRFGDYDALLFPTWEREPFGFVAVEAAAAGCIPILTSVIGASEWFLDGVDSVKIGRNSESLAAAMISVIAMPKAQLSKMKISSRINANNNMQYKYWMEIFEDRCHYICNRWKGAVADINGLQSSFLYLSDIWRSHWGG